MTKCRSGLTLILLIYPNYLDAPNGIRTKPVQALVRVMATFVLGA
jgi:hypothetical protein